MTLAEVNTMDRDSFAAAVGWVYEHSPWVAERAWDRRPFNSLAALHKEMAAVVEAATPEEQLALIRAHPDLGARARMTAASAGEQAGAGLDRLSAEEFERLHRLNLAYRMRFGFPFLYAVRGSSKEDVLAALEARLNRDPETEHAIALEQIYRIAQFRLEGLLHASLHERQ